MILILIAESDAKAIAIQQEPLDSLAKAALGNRRVLDHLLAKQGGICAMANTTYCTWINTSGKVETQLYKITKQAVHPKKVTLST